MEVLEMVDVKISVNLDEREIEVPCTAIYGKFL